MFFKVCIIHCRGHVFHLPCRLVFSLGAQNVLLGLSLPFSAWFPVQVWTEGAVGLCWQWV